MKRKYRCMKCFFAWEGCRVLRDEHGRIHRFSDPPLRGGMTECPKCPSIYVEWLNWLEILNALGRYWER
jgi:hypothetical protein